MGAYILERLFHSLPVLIIVSVLTFLGMELVPGDPVLALVGDPSATAASVSPEDIERLRSQYGLDQPLPIRYVKYMSRVVQGDFGHSVTSRRPVTDVIRERLPVSLWLNSFTLLVGISAGLTLGTIAGIRPGTRTDLAVTFLAVVGVAVPGFWLAIFLILTFSLKLDWLPASGWVSPLSSPVGAFEHLLLPVITLSLPGIAVVARQTRSGLVEVMRHDYITTARSKGLSAKAVVLRHAMKNAMLPVVTIIGLQVAALFGGSVLIERVFAIPGLGRLAYDATYGHDFPVLQALIFMVTLSVICMNLVTDIAYAFLDPRIRHA